MGSPHPFNIDRYWLSQCLFATNSSSKMLVFNSTDHIIYNIISVFQLHAIFVQLAIGCQQLPMTSDNAKFSSGFIPDKPVM